MVRTRCEVCKRKLWPWERSCKECVRRWEGRMEELTTIAELNTVYGSMAIANKGQA